MCSHIDWQVVSSFMPTLTLVLPLSLQNKVLLLARKREILFALLKKRLEEKMFLMARVGKGICLR